MAHVIHAHDLFLSSAYHMMHDQPPHVGGKLPLVARELLTQCTCTYMYTYNVHNVHVCIDLVVHFVAMHLHNEWVTES